MPDKMKRTRSKTQADHQPKPKVYKTDIIGTAETVDLRVPANETHRMNIPHIGTVDRFIEEFVTYVIWDRHGNQMTFLGVRHWSPWVSDMGKQGSSTILTKLLTPNADNPL